MPQMTKEYLEGRDALRWCMRNAPEHVKRLDLKPDAPDFNAGGWGGCQQGLDWQRGWNDEHDAVFL